MQVRQIWKFPHNPPIWNYYYERWWRKRYRSCCYCCCFSAFFLFHHFRMTSISMLLCYNLIWLAWNVETLNEKIKKKAHTQIEERNTHTHPIVRRKLNVPQIQFLINSLITPHKYSQLNRSYRAISSQSLRSANTEIEKKWTRDRKKQREKIATNKCRRKRIQNKRHECTHPTPTPC